MITPDQADALRDAINYCRHTSRHLTMAEGRQAVTAILDDDAARDKVNQIISELTQENRWTNLNQPSMHTAQP